MVVVYFNWGMCKQSQLSSSSSTISNAAGNQLPWSAWSSRNESSNKVDGGTTWERLSCTQWELGDARGNQPQQAVLVHLGVIKEFFINRWIGGNVDQSNYLRLSISGYSSPPRHMRPDQHMSMTWSRQECGIPSLTKLLLLRQTEVISRQQSMEDWMSVLSRSRE